MSDERDACGLLACLLYFLEETRLFNLKALDASCKLLLLSVHKASCCLKLKQSLTTTANNLIPDRRWT